eukprot:CAMPEP_0202479036 /NCGR_PEP_ID=MMETSP1360-20130828/94771_1 /ASSEMBLY_ACC=CAM_ASM_000848 /TAXON_ID=515479 /ORGANISM="Licmophora paradoxa, Strain CCMP2313" /LENGTH=247 /DNA_ID=CAMNT_0049106345 /DNA_START=552 /DNA_END=1297 /DNA_ORIENTATION=-
MVLPRPRTSLPGNSRKRKDSNDKDKTIDCHQPSSFPMATHHHSKKLRASMDIDLKSHSSDQTTLHHNRSGMENDQAIKVINLTKFESWMQVLDSALTSLFQFCSKSPEPKELDDPNQEQEENDEPDWEHLARQEPSKSNVPKFLEARENLEAAEARFGTVLDEFLTSFKTAQEAMLQIAVDIHNTRREKLDTMEAEFKHTVVSNDEVRTKMEERLKETASAAQGLFQHLMMRISNPSRRPTDLGETA